MPMVAPRSQLDCKVEQAPQTAPLFVACNSACSLRESHEGGNASLLSREFVSFDPGPSPGNDTNSPASWRWSANLRDSDLEVAGGGCKAISRGSSHTEIIGPSPLCRAGRGRPSGKSACVVLHSGNAFYEGASFSPGGQSPFLRHVQHTSCICDEPAWRANARSEVGHKPPH